MIFLPLMVIAIRALGREVPFSEEEGEQRRVHGSEKQKKGEDGPSEPTEAPSKPRITVRKLRVGGWALGRDPSLHQEKMLLLSTSHSKALGSSEFREMISGREN